MKAGSPVALVPLSLAAILSAGTISSTDVFTSQQKNHWSFQPVKEQSPPAVQRAAWVRNPIDAFVLAKLEAKRIAPNAEADRITLLRRVSFDLTGLPPAPEEVTAFLNDKSPNAYEKVVDRLLASPHYGERWARHWLDLARYAESEGFKSDETRPNAWRYRDYVIESLNANKPYSRFVQEQIAGDEMWPDDPKAKVATAFNRHWPDESNARNLFQRRQEILDDITDVTGATFLGLTVGCARCHNHKYDPILQADYYRLQSFYANTAADDHIPMLPAPALKQHQVAMAVWEEKTKDIRAEMQALLAPRKAAIAKDNVDKFPPEIQAILARPANERSPYEVQMALKALPYQQIEDETAAKSLKGDAKARYQELREELKKYASLFPGELPVGIGMHDAGAAAPPTRILKGGAWDNPADPVEPGFLSLLAPGPARIVKPSAVDSTGRRTALAKWITDPTNPLTARVAVNRLWHWHFGSGIVATPSDFGIMGTRPTHPELLDWLATEFVKSGWDMKHMHKLIVTSSTYRQSAEHNEISAKADARNRLLWRFPRQRLEGEVIRDAMLAVSGVLNPRVGGPSIMPELPEGMPAPRGGWTVSKGEDRNRRSVYIFVRRNARYPMLEAFDMPDTHESCGRRNITVTAPQALSLLNDKTVLEQARAFAGRVVREGGSDLRHEVERAYELAFSRKPDGAERDTVLTFFDRQEKIVAKRVAAGEKIALPAGEIPAGIDQARAAALVDFCHMLLNSNEFVYRN
jgi:hypothetical protein